MQKSNIKYQNEKDLINYYLPEDRIALHPVSPRDSCRLMVVDLPSLDIEDKRFNDIADYLEKGDAVCVNDSRVIHARLKGKKHTGANVEFLLLEKEDIGWKALGKPSARLKQGTQIQISSPNTGTCTVGISNKFDGGYFMLDTPDDILKYGHVPLPPYIGARRKTAAEDFENYQTIFAAHPGSAASPTAGLHFTKELALRLEKKGVRFAPVTLHVGAGTFRPVGERPGCERFLISGGSAEIINSAKRILVCGTTVMRALESSHRNGKLYSCSGRTDLFIEPPYRFRTKGMFLTNFHLPGTPLLSMVAAYVEQFLPDRGEQALLELYRHAIDKKYRFLSYGDAMLFKI
jgi:S-adenosylmethionine:tRNA ribosyltransferase-isomerase